MANYEQYMNIRRYGEILENWEWLEEAESQLNGAGLHRLMLMKADGVVWCAHLLNGELVKLSKVE